MTRYDDSVRQTLRASLVSSGAPPASVAEIIDLACHASDQAVETLFTVARRASDVPTMLVTIEIATQLASSHLTAIFERTNSLAKAVGVPQSDIEIGISL